MVSIVHVLTIILLILYKCVTGNYKCGKFLTIICNNAIKILLKSTDILLIMIEYHCCNAITQKFWNNLEAMHGRSVHHVF